MTRRMRLRIAAVVAFAAIGLMAGLAIAGANETHTNFSDTTTVLAGITVTGLE